MKLSLFKSSSAALALLALVACTDSKLTSTISVVGNLGDEKPIYLRTFYTGDSLMQAQTVEDNIVTFVIETTEPTYVTIDRSANKSGTSVISVIADGSPVVVGLDGDSFKIDSFKIKDGSSENMALAKAQAKLNEMDELFKPLLDEFDAVAERYNQEIPDSLLASFQQRYGELSVQEVAIKKDLVRDNTENHVPIYFLCRYYDDLGTEFIDSFLPTYRYKDSKDLEPVKKLMDAEKNKLPGAPVVDFVGKDLNDKLPGAPVVDFVGKDLNDKECHLTDYVGKGEYVLVDFWASWCGPCRGEIPNVKANYDKYRQKGFQVVGISFDDSKEDWQKAVQELGHITSIPATILYDPEGKVLKTNLRGEGLGQALQEIFGE